jgi:pimeloyl-ACP methyl ester carboxylesterase
MAIIPPVIVLPGITGTNLRDEYQLPPEMVWGVLKKDYPRVALHPDNPRYEASEPARVQPDSLMDIAYKELIQELRHNLSRSDDQPVPVYPFNYDWRQRLDAVVEQFAGFVDEVIERTKLLRHYARQGYAEAPRVNLVGHSMGGLIIAGYLDLRGKDARVAKVATLGTPFGGSFEAVIKVVTGTADLGPDEPRSREREAARLTPALYHLLPDFKGALEINDPKLPASLYDPGLWQAGVLKTLEKYVQLHSVSKTDQSQQAQTLFSGLLNAGKQYRSRIAALSLSKSKLRPEDWLCVAGVHSATRVRLKISNTRQGPVFDLGSDYRLDGWMKDPENPAAWRSTGDGTVPFDAALPPFLGIENVVCVTPEDYGYWEIQDRLAVQVAGFHAILPNMDMLHRLIVRHFTGDPDRLGNTWGRPAPGVSAAQWRPPMKLQIKP